MQRIIESIAPAFVQRRIFVAAGLSLALAAALAVTLAPAATGAPARTAEAVAAEQWGGAVSGVTTAGDLAYAAIGPRLAVLDVRDVAAPRQFGQSAPIDDILTHLFVRGDHVFGLGETTGLVVFDVADPARPRLVGRFATLGAARDLDIAADRAFICDDKGGLRIVSLTDPAQPTEIGSWNRMAGALETAVADGTHVFAIVEGSPPTLTVLDVTGRRPAVVAEVELRNVVRARDLTLDAGWLYVADSNGVIAVDVHDPSSPIESVAEPTVTSTVEAVLARDGVVWAASSGELYVLDARDPVAELTVRGVFELDNNLYPAISLAAGRAYFADTGGLRIVAIEDPFAEPIVGAWSPNEASQRHAVDVARLDDYVVVAANAGGLEVLDVSDPASAVEVAALPAVPGDRDNRGTWRVTLDGERAYTAEGGLGGGVRVIDLRDPTQPRDIGRISAPGTAGRPSVEGDLVAVPTRGDDANGVRLYRVAPSGVPSAVGWLPLDHGADAAMLAGPRLYAGGYDGFWIIDVSDPTSPVLHGSLSEISGWGGIVELDGGRVVVADVNLGLNVVDVSDPAAPAVIERIALAGGADDVIRAGDELWVANNYAGVTRLAIVPGAAPRVVGHWFVDQAVFAAAPGVDAAWLVVDEGGLIALDRAAPSMPRDAGVYVVPGYLVKVGIDDGQIVARSSLNTDRIVLHVLDDGAPVRPTGQAWPGVLTRDADAGDALEVVAGTAWLPGGNRGIIGYDVRRPGPIRRLTADDGAQPFEVQHLAVSGTMAVALDPSKLMVFDLTDPVHPVVSGLDYAVHGGFAVAIAGSVAWVLASKGAGGTDLGADRTDLVALDIAVPSAIAELGRWPLPAPAYDLAASGDRLAVACGAAGLLIWDIARPSAADAIATLALRGRVEAVALAGNLAWIEEIGAQHTIDAVDIGAPDGPAVVGAATIADWYDVDIAAEGVSAAVANGHAGLYVLHFQGALAATASATAPSSAPATPTPRDRALYLPLAYARRSPDRAVIAIDRSRAMAPPAAADGGAAGGFVGPSRLDVARDVAARLAVAGGAHGVRVSIVTYDQQAERWPALDPSALGLALAGLAIDRDATFAAVARHDVALAAVAVDMAALPSARCASAVLITAGRPAGASADGAALARAGGLAARGIAAHVVRVGADPLADEAWLARLAGDPDRLLVAGSMPEAAAIADRLADDMLGCR